jgi:hypothetical protein
MALGASQFDIALMVIAQAVRIGGGIRERPDSDGLALRNELIQEGLMPRIDGTSSLPAAIHRQLPCLQGLPNSRDIASRP